MPRHLVRPAGRDRGPAAQRDAARSQIVGDELGARGSRTPTRTTSSTTTGRSSSRTSAGRGAATSTRATAYAVVWLNGCPDVPTDGIEAHELLHALGALPIGAPNACTPATSPFGGFDTGHPCDSTSDVLYPQTDGRPLQQMVLDFNHDDYYAHTGNWDDIQDSIFLHHLDVPQVELRVGSRARAR